MTASTRKLKYNLLFPLVLSFLLSGCLGIRHLKEGERLLYKQKIEGAKNLGYEELEVQLRQTPNKRTPIFPWALYVNMYYWGLKHYDSARYASEKQAVILTYDAKIANAEAAGKQKKAAKLETKKTNKVARLDKTLEEGNLRMRWGEKLVVYDSSLRVQSEELLETYLQSEGFFNAGVDSRARSNGKLVTVTYVVEPGEPYIIDSLVKTIPDENVRSLVGENSDNSLLLKGKQYRQEDISAERERLYELLVNNGYYRFNRQYITFRVDTSSLGNRRVMIEMEIMSPGRGENHRKFVLDSVNFITDANLSYPGRQRESRIYNNVTYSFYEEKYSKKILDWRVFLYPDSIYSRENTFETQRQLANLDIFKFVNINYDTTGNRMVANIFTSPLQKYQTSTEVGVNVSQGLPGPVLNFSAKDRNVFHGLEILEFSGRFGIEGIANPLDVTRAYASTEYGGNLSLTFPQFVIPTNLRRRNYLGRLNPRTRLLVGTTFTDRGEYKRSNFNSSWAYIWQRDNSRLFTLTLADLSFIDSELSPRFTELLEDYQSRGNLLINSFKPSYVGSTSFAVAVNNNSYGIARGNSSFFRIYLETSGNSLFFFDSTSLADDRLEYYQFSKANVDFRKVHSMSAKHDLAYRVNVGVAVSYGINTVLPYEKYFFAGGSNGIRAWRPRRLGPGSYTPDTLSDGRFDYRFEQPGDILLEASIEYRRRLFGFVSWAYFIDAGNVWTLRNDPTRPGSQFEVDRFAREIAVGSGFGLRFDFSFLILRLDFGSKMYDPARPEGDRWIVDKLIRNFPFGEKNQTIPNIGIGYSF